MMNQILNQAQDGDIGTIFGLSVFTLCIAYYLIDLHKEKKRP